MTGKRITTGRLLLRNLQPTTCSILIQCSQQARPVFRPPEAWPAGRGLCGPETAWSSLGHRFGSLGRSGLAWAGPGYMGGPRLYAGQLRLYGLVQTICRPAQAMQASPGNMQAGPGHAGQPRLNAGRSRRSRLYASRSRQ